MATPVVALLFIYLFDLYFTLLYIRYHPPHSSLQAGLESGPTAGPQAPVPSLVYMCLMSVFGVYSVLLVGLSAIDLPPLTLSHSSIFFSFLLVIL